ncbi:unnamed protein product, partial [Mesorhabditis spiculigera]
MPPMIRQSCTLDLQIRPDAFSRPRRIWPLLQRSTLHPQIDGWPVNWMPYPIHSVPGPEDTLDEEGSSDCKRIGLLRGRREKDTGYVQYLLKNQDFLNQLTTWARMPINDAYSINKLWDTLYCQRAHNMTMPPWLSDSIWSKLNEMFIYTDDYLDGSAVPGIGNNENTELLALRSGELLGQMLSSMTDAVNNKPHWKFHVYSAHDSTITALLRIYHNMYSVLGVNNPGYASHLVHELWKDTSGQYYVQVLFSDGPYTDYRSITYTLDECSHYASGCPWKIFNQGYASYVIPNFWQRCAQTN